METWRKGKRVPEWGRGWGGEGAGERCRKGEGAGEEQCPHESAPKPSPGGFWHSAQMSSLSPVLTQVDRRAQDSGPISVLLQLSTTQPSPGALLPPGPLLPAADLWLQPGPWTHTALGAWLSWAPPMSSGRGWAAQSPWHRPGVSSALFPILINPLKYVYFLNDKTFQTIIKVYTTQT